MTTNTISTAVSTIAYQLTDYSIENISTIKAPVKKPSENEVVVHIKAASLNYRDLLVAKGLYSQHLKLPLTILSDAAGQVVEIGSSVTRVKVGDRVCPIFTQRWLSGELDLEKSNSALGGAQPGIATEYGVFSEEGLIHIPEHLSYEEAATLPCAAVTAWRALFGLDSVGPHSTVLTQGSGGVSIFALQFAKAAGASVIATTSNHDKLKKLKQLGADHVINYKETPDWDKRVLELTKGRGVDHIIEVGGGQTLARSLHACRIGGTVSVIGVLSGAAQLNHLPIIMKSLRLIGVFVGSRENFEHMNQAITKHQIKPVINRTYPISEIKEALHYLESGAHFGKIVLQL